MTDSLPRATKKYIGKLKSARKISDISQFM